MQKRLYRSRKDRIIAGVAGGLGEYFDIDPVIIRIIFVVAGLVGGSGILAYIICWIIIPQESLEHAAPGSSAKRPTPKEELPASTIESSPRRASIPGILLIVLGVLFLAHNLLPRFQFGDFWPVLLIVIGIAILLRSYPYKDKGGGQS